MRARTRAIVLSLGLALPALAIAGQTTSGCFWSFEDCPLTLGFGCKGAASSGTTGTGGGGGTGGTGGASSTTTSTGTGTGGKPECLGTDTSTCKAVPDGPCKAFAARTCVAGKCVVTYMDADAPSQKYGSCKKTKCGGSGALMDIPYDMNQYDDGNPCTMKSCTNGVPGDVPLNTGVTCTTMGMSGYCEQDPYSGNIACLECDPLMQSTCGGKPGTTCVKGACVPNHCTDNLKNFGETDVDCGGACLKCLDPRVCLADSDCASGTCTMNKCAAPTCPDGNQNQDETDVDCGGLHCLKRCADGKKCFLGSDCQSGVCKPPLMPGPNTCQAPTCTDGVQNRDEAGVDCGGPVAMCPPCAM